MNSGRDRFKIAAKDLHIAAITNIFLSVTVTKFFYILSCRFLHFYSKERDETKWFHPFHKIRKLTVVSFLIVHFNYLVRHFRLFDFLTKNHLQNTTVTVVVNFYFTIETSYYFKLFSLPSDRCNYFYKISWSNCFVNLNFK